MFLPELRDGCQGTLNREVGNFLNLKMYLSGILTQNIIPIPDIPTRG
jgi:hypothetical protein